MIRKQAFREYTREYLHALRNGKSENEAAAVALDRTRECVAKELADKSELEAMEIWGAILELIVDYESILRVLPIDKAKIPPKSEMPAVELETITQQGKG